MVRELEQDRWAAAGAEQVVPGPGDPPPLGVHKPWPYNPPGALAERLRLTLSDFNRAF